MFNNFALLASMASAVAAFVPLNPQYNPPNCHSMIVPITISPSVYNLTQFIPATNFNLTNLITEFASTPSNISIGTATPTTGNVNISARICYPTVSNVTAKQNSTVQFLIHGIGFDMGYWDILESPETYSYTRALNAAGYTTFAIDRLGIGNSSPGLPNSNLQSTSGHIATVGVLTNMLRAGAFGKSFTNVVHVGHSYGSIITNGLVGMSPNSSQGLILTGYSAFSGYIDTTLAAFNLQLSSQQAPERFGEGSNTPLPNEYTSFGDIGANQLAFFKYPAFDPLLLYYANARAQPVTIAELLTMATGTVPTKFSGPVRVITGENDFIFCGGNCNQKYLNYSSIPAQSQSLFANASSFSTYLPPGTGHGVNSHLTAPGTYANVVSFMNQYFK